MTLRLIVGLGNPGKDYADTRHNIGFMVVEGLADALGLSWKVEGKFLGRLAKGQGPDGPVLLYEPTTYMNASGQGIRKMLDFFKVDQADILVICDDIDLPFGALRLREKGGPGTHNGLKSVQAHLGGPQYKRLRIGVGNRKHGTLSDFVLGRFNTDEQAELPLILDRATGLCRRMIAGEAWHQVVQEANVRPKKETKQQQERGTNDNNNQKEPV